MKATRTKKIMSIVLAASMLLAMGVTAFAAEADETDTVGVESQREFRRGSMKAPGVRLVIGHNLLDDLDENDVLSETQMAEVTKFMDDFRTEREETREGLSEMTRDERRAYFEENKNDFEGPIERMVDEEIISADQAAAIRNLMPERGQRDSDMERGQRNSNMERGTKNGMSFGDRNGAGSKPQMNCEES